MDRARPGNFILCLVMLWQIILRISYFRGVREEVAFDLDDLRIIRICAEACLVYLGV